MTGQARPNVTLKIATSLDGRIATASGQSQWITSEVSREHVQSLRASHDAILVGSQTAIADNPMLTARTDPPPARQPVRIVADSRLRTPLESKLVTTTDQARTVLAVGVDVDEVHYDPYEDAGADVWVLPIAPLMGVSVNGLLSRAHEDGIRSILLEGGGRLAASFLRAGVVDRIEWFRAPIIIGGDGLPCVAEFGLDDLAAAPSFKRTSLQESGPDIWESYERPDTTGEG